MPVPSAAAMYCPSCYFAVLVQIMMKMAHVGTLEQELLFRASGWSSSSVRKYREATHAPETLPTPPRLMATYFLVRALYSTRAWSPNSVRFIWFRAKERLVGRVRLEGRVQRRRSGLL